MLIVLCGFFIPSFSREDTIYSKRSFAAVEVQVPPEIDGLLSDDAWKALRKFAMRIGPKGVLTEKESAGGGRAVDTEVLLAELPLFARLLVNISPQNEHDGGSDDGELDQTRDQERLEPRHVTVQAEFQL